jgi:chromosome segregation ATPase
MNIDKDIEYLKGYKYDNEVKQAIENVLKELEELQDDLSIHEETSFEFQEENIKLRKELETYKKIAKKLADKLVEIEDGCKHIPTEICNEYSNGRCIKCIIDWARKEVEK